MVQAGHRIVILLDDMTSGPRSAKVERPFTAILVKTCISGPCSLVLVLGGMLNPGPAQAGTVYYFNERTHPGLIQSELLYTYQGVVNRNGPKIFVISDSYEDNWVTWTAAQFGDTFVQVTDPWALLSNTSLNQYCRKFVAYNSANCKLAPNAGATQAAIYAAACMVDKQDGGATYNKLVAAPYSFTCVEDMSAYWTGTGAEVACENWQRDHQLTNTVLSDSWYCLKQGVWETYPGTPKGLDYCLSERMLVFMADKGNIWGLNNYTACEELMVAHYPTLTTAFGWWVDNAATGQQEDITVGEVLSAQKHGFYGHGYNCSFFKWYGVPPGKTMTQYTHTLSVTNYSTTNKYVVLSMSQGDNSGWLTKLDTGYVTTTSSNPSYSGVPIYRRYPFAMFCDTAQATKISSWPLWKLYQVTWGYDVRFMGKGFDYVKLPALNAAGGLSDWDSVTQAGMAAAGMTELVAIDYQSSIKNNPTKDPLPKVLTEVRNARCLFFRDDAGFTPGTENDNPTLVGGKWVFADPVKQKQDAEGNFSAALTGEAIRTNSRRFFWVFYGAQPITDLEATGDYLTAHAPNVKILGLDQFVQLWLAVQAAQNPTNLSCAKSGTNFTVSWPSNYTGWWVLQVQTNSLMGNWFSVPASLTTNSLTFPIGRTNKAVFYRQARTF
jgi:hypothetical protein